MEPGAALCLPPANGEAGCHVTYWQGINRPEIEAACHEAITRLLGLPAEKVFVVDDASNATAPKPPFVSIRLLPSTSDVGPTEVSWVDGLEYHRFVIGSSDDGVYAVVVDGIAATHTASLQTITQIRDALLAGLAGPNFTAVSAGSTAIDVESTVPRRRLLPEVIAGDIGLAQYRGNLCKVTHTPVTCVLQALCFGVYEPTTMSAATSGVDMAEKLCAGMLEVDRTRAMRDANHHPIRGRVTDISRITDGESEKIGQLELVISTTIWHINPDLSDVTAMSFEYTGS